MQCEKGTWAKVTWKSSGIGFMQHGNRPRSFVRHDFPESASTMVGPKETSRTAQHRPQNESCRKQLDCLVLVTYI